MNETWRKVRKVLKRYGPNTSDRAGLVSLDDAEPFLAFWPMRFTQLVGGRRWSLSICVFRTGEPMATDGSQARRYLKHPPGPEPITFAQFANALERAVRDVD